MSANEPGAERRRVETLGRLENGLRQGGDWYQWGPYVSERQWGTVREDYSAHGTAWEYLPHDHARSRAYRWGEDGLAGFCDVEQRLCLGLALWNGRDPILKERIFGLTGNQGNHGEDAKEYWWYLDATPTHSWNRWRYHYPQGEFPYARLVQENAARGKLDPEFELLDTGIFDDDRFWIVEAHYAKADALDILLTSRSRTPGPRRRRCTCSRPPGTATRGPGRSTADAPACGPQRPARGSRPSIRSSAPSRSSPTTGPTAVPELALLRQRDERRTALRRAGAVAVPEGRDQRPRRRRARTRSTPTARARRRHSTTGSRSLPARPSSCGFASVRRTSPAPPGPTSRRSSDAAARGRRVLRGADAAGVLGGRGERHAAGVRRDALGQAALLLRRRALAGRRPDAAAAAGIAARRAATPLASTSRPSTSCRCRTRGSTRGSQPGTWRSTASRSHTSIRRSRSTSSHSSAASGSSIRTARCRRTSGPSTTSTHRCRRGRRCRCSRSTAAATPPFLSRIFDKLLVNFTWWVNRQDADGSNVFEGGFLGLDNIGPIDRSHLPAGLHARAGRRDRLDGGLRPDDGGDGRAPEPDVAAGPRPRPEVPRALLAHRARRWTRRGSGTRRTASTTTAAAPDGSACRSRFARWWACCR